MASKRALERRLATLASFSDPRVELEQYSTPAGLAAHLVHLADLSGDLAGRTVVDLGTGTGVLALGAALRGADQVVGIDRDPAALAVARGNARDLDPPVSVAWVLADAARPPVCPPDPVAVTVVMNPPFGAQRGHEHADRAFLAAAARLAGASYSIHNAGSREFVEAFVADNGGRITHAFAVGLALDRQFPFHTAARAEIDAEAYRVVWGRSRPPG